MNCWHFISTKAAETAYIRDEYGTSVRSWPVNIWSKYQIQVIKPDFHHTPLFLHVGLGAAEGHPPTADWILVLVCVNPCINHSSKQIVEDLGQNFCVQHSMQRSNEDGFLGVKFLVGMLDEVAVIQNPRNNLNFLTSHSSTGYFEVISSIALRTLWEKIGNKSLVIKHNINISFRWRWGTFFARPFNSNGSKLTEGLNTEWTKCWLPFLWLVGFSQGKG